ITIEEGKIGLEQIDYMLYSANQHNVRLLLTLTNNWIEFGGMDSYTYHLGGKYHDDFYTNEKIKNAFKNYVKTLLNRVNTYTGVAYKDYVYTNEPRCSGSGRLPSSGKCTLETLMAWYDEMSTFIKTYDPNHMVTIGDEGFGLPKPDAYSYTPYPYSGDGGILDAYERNIALPNIDFGTFHLYTKDWGLPGNDIDSGTYWINAHGDVANKVGKPIIFEEYGIREKEDRSKVYGAWHNACINKGIDAALFWMIAVDEYEDYDGYTLYDSTITTLIDPFTKKLLSLGGSCSPKSSTTTKNKITTTTNSQKSTNDVNTSCFSYPDYPCCQDNIVVYSDNDGDWGVENNEWCGINSSSSCWSKALGYECCTGCSVVYTDNDGDWGVENNEWCGIIC
ncbi:family 5 glycoside hydrolase, partial [Piromyces sp. E2]